MRCRTAAFSVLACSLVLRASSAAGQTAPPAPERWPTATPEIASEPTAPAPPVATRWYGWQMLLADGSAATLTIALSASVDQHDDTAVLGAIVAGASVFVLGGPIIHAVHGHWERAAGSLGLRVGLPLLGAAIGMGVADCGQYAYDHDGCAAGAAFFGALLGAITATIIDSAGLGRDEVAIRAQRNAPIVGFTPLRGGGGLTLGARF